jgi:pantothenate kinase-related protein Tda10
MKIIFLDIDGVLNSVETYEKVKKAHKKGLTLNYGPRGTIYNLHDKQMVANLNEIIKQTGAYIVLSSCWRYGLNSQGEIKALLNKILKIKGNVLGKTPEFKMNQTRANEIQAWLNLKLPYYERLLGKIDSFIILDDDNNFGHLQKCLIRTDKFKGLTRESVEKAIIYLNSAN